MEAVDSDREFAQNRRLCSQMTTHTPKLSTECADEERWPAASKYHALSSEETKKHENLQAKWYQRNTERENHTENCMEMAKEIYSVPVVAPRGALGQSTTIF